MKKRPWPEWWNWEIELTPHVLKRMEDRNFSVIELRAMLHRSHDYREDIVEDRWIVSSRHKRHLWEIIVEPDYLENLLVIITAYPVWSE